MAFRRQKWFADYIVEELNFCFEWNKAENRFCFCARGLFVFLFRMLPRFELKARILRTVESLIRFCFSGIQSSLKFIFKKSLNQKHKFNTIRCFGLTRQNRSMIYSKSKNPLRCVPTSIINVSILMCYCTAFTSSMQRWHQLLKMFHFYPSLSARVHHYPTHNIFIFTLMQIPQHCMSSFVQ